VKTILVLLLAMLVSGCGYSKKTSAPQPGVVPAVTQLVPNSAKAGDPAFVLTLNGSTFNSDAQVNFGRAHPTTTFVTTNQLTAMIPASSIATPGTVAVTVTNPGHAAGGIYGDGGTTAETSSPMNFTVN
jgi:hypothetical protein